jgi:hypothetical protein
MYSKLKFYVFGLNVAGQVCGHAVWSPLNYPPPTKKKRAHVCVYCITKLLASPEGLTVRVELMMKHEFIFKL